MSNLVPKAKGQKLTYVDIEHFPEKPTELFSGNFLFTEAEKKALLLAYTVNFGLDFLVGILPNESVKELKDLLNERGVDK